jgi:hypothetical protein
MLVVSILRMVITCNVPMMTMIWYLLLIVNYLRIELPSAEEEHQVPIFTPLSEFLYIGTTADEIYGRSYLLGR